MLKKTLFRVDETYSFSNSLRPLGWLNSHWLLPSFKNTLQQHEILIIFTYEDKI